MKTKYILFKVGVHIYADENTVEDGIISVQFTYGDQKNIQLDYNVFKKIAKPVSLIEHLEEFSKETNQNE